MLCKLGLRVLLGFAAPLVDWEIYCKSLHPNLSAAVVLNIHCPEMSFIVRRAYYSTTSMDTKLVPILHDIVCKKLR